MNDSIEQLEAVYYTSPIPYDLGTLTFLGLVFDRVHFPNVHIPVENFDPEWVAAEIKRLEELPPPHQSKRYERWLLTHLMKYALVPELQQFRLFTGSRDQVFGGEQLKDATGLVNALYEQIFGPPEEGFTPMFNTGHSKSLGNDEAIDYPGDFYYQSNALLYSARHEIPLLNADSSLPVPSLGEGNARHNVKLLSAVMAMECVKLVLPKIPTLQPHEILEARHNLAEYLRPFRLALLRMANTLNSGIDDTTDAVEIQRAAEFIAQTEIYPTLEEVKNELDRPRKGWMGRSWEMAKKVPELVALYATLNLREALPKTVEALGDWFVSGISANEPRSDLYYLLKLRDELE